MRRFGFKFFSSNFLSNSTCIKECIDFIASKDDLFIEIMVVEESTEDDLLKIKRQIKNTDVRIHAPYTNFDTGNKEAEQQNRKLFAISQKAADIFKSPTIVAHCGNGHGRKYIEETARQFKNINDDRIVIENIPYFGCNGELLHGNTAEELSYITKESGCGFCFDFSHAICAALSLNINIETQLKDFFALKPNVYHLCDGNISKATDLHLHYGTGNYPLKHYLKDYTDANAYITMETGSGFETNNSLRIKDYEYLKSLQNS